MGIPSDPDDLIDLPDPTSVYYDGVYYQYGGHEVISSVDLKHWSQPIPYFLDTPTWSNGEPGAPSVIQMSDNQWNIYYNVPHKDCNDTNTLCQCLAVSISHSGPNGPFKSADNDSPIICDSAYDWIVDPCIRRMTDGQFVLYWKTTFATTSNNTNNEGS